MNDKERNDLYILRRDLLRRLDFLITTDAESEAIIHDAKELIKIEEENNAN